MRESMLRWLVVAALIAPAASLAAAQEPGKTAGASKPAAAPVNLNTASADQLTALPGIGERTAQRIVEHRQKNGPFKRVEDLMNVKGIGEKSFLRLKPLVTVTPPKADAGTPEGS